MAIGVFGMGMGGTAISALTTVKLTAHGASTRRSSSWPARWRCTARAAALVLRDAPGRPVPDRPALARLAATLRLSITWQAAALYAVGFGGFVAFSVYLPVYLKNAYLLTPADAANKMAGFVLVAVLLRPVGGWLSDRVAPTRVLAGAFAVVATAAVVQSLTPALARWAPPRSWSWPPPWARRGRGVRPGGAARPGPAGRRGDRRGGRGRRPRRVRAAAGHGRHLRRDRNVRLGPAGPGRRGRGGHGLQPHHRTPAGRRPRPPDRRRSVRDADLAPLAPAGAGLGRGRRRRGCGRRRRAATGTTAGSSRRAPAG